MKTDRIWTPGLRPPLWNSVKAEWFLSLFFKGFISFFHKWYACSSLHFLLTYRMYIFIVLSLGLPLSLPEDLSWTPSISAGFDPRTLGSRRAPYFEGTVIKCWNCIKVLKPMCLYDIKMYLYLKTASHAMVPCSTPDSTDWFQLRIVRNLGSYWFVAVILV